MADSRIVLSASGQVITGKGQLTGMMISTSGTTGTATFYNNTSGTGTKVLEVIVSAGHPAIVFFSDAFSPRFTAGLFLVLAANMSATVWARATS
jgi:hypothetical protein